MDLDAQMDRLFQAFANQDRDTITSVLAPEFRGTQNGSPPASADDTLAMVTKMFWEPGFTIEYSNIRRVSSDQAVAEQHDVRIARPDGVEVILDVCVVARFDADGRVVTLDEYADSARLAPLMA